MTASLVAQVPQINGQQAKELAQSVAGEVPTLEEARQFPSFGFGTGINDFVLELWAGSEVITRAGLSAPYCMHSQSEDGAWNFSWGFDFPNQEVSTRSCFYRILPDGAVECREYPNEVLKATTVRDGIMIALAVVSDLLQTHDWDQEVAVKALVQKLSTNG